MRELERDPTHSFDSAALREPLAIVGAGRVGRSLARAALGAGLDVELAGRRDAVAAAESGRIALLCVPDAAIAPACEAIAAAVPPLRFVGHVSGATPLTALAAARRRGAEAFCIHPLQTVPDGDTSLAGAPCAISGSSPEASALASGLASRLGLRPFTLADDQRTAYHAAACMASNFLVALEESAAELLERVGIDDARELLGPLVLRTAANWAELGGEALTGPIARGDEQTIDRHLDAIAAVSPELIDLYRTLAARTRALAGGTEIAV
jgi:predicted short-subunit dehydrogenase-like oxidoreductase (DUF2520 family)